MTSSEGQAFVQEPSRSTPVRAEADALVVGGGAAGVSAAVAAARNGADVMLVERYGYLGGLATGGLIILLLTLDDGRGRQVVGGLCQEVTDRLAKRGAAYFPPEAEWEATTRRWSNTPPAGGWCGAADRTGCATPWPTSLRS